MSKLGKYCKAYPLHQLRQFSGWTEERQNARKIRKEIDGEIAEVVRELTDADYLYVQENLTVTDGIFLDENVIFSDVTSEWIEFCRKVLGWRVPSEESVIPTESNQFSGEAGNA